MEITFFAIVAAFLLTYGLSWTIHWRQRFQRLEISLNTVVAMDFHSVPGTVSVGYDCLMVFHPLLVRNFYPFAEISKVSVIHWLDSRLAVTWNDGNRLDLLTPWAKELKGLLEGQLRTPAGVGRRRKAAV